MATQKEEKEEQAFFAERIKEQNKMATPHKTHESHEPKAVEPKTEEHLDSLGQKNPAFEMEQNNIKDANERAVKAEKEKKTPD